MTRPARLIPAVLVCLLTAVVASAATRYDPRLRFRTISTVRFDIHFHQGEDSIAQRLARLVEDAAAEVDRAVGAPAGRVQIVLVDQHDLSNGWATPLPYNTIEISAAAPAADSSLGNTDDWLRLVFIHEYTHIAHLSRARGWIGGLRRGFGRLPVLFPNLYQPIWGIEGLATWRETEGPRQGRLAAGDFRQLIESAALAGTLEPLDRANGGNPDWPSGSTPYVYGAFFHRYLAERYGPDSIRTLVDETSRRLPYLGSRAYSKVFGRSLGQLWKDFEASTAEAARAAAVADGAPLRLTHHGFIVSGPRYGEDARLFYSAASPHHFPALFEARGAPAAPRQVAKRYLGNRIGISPRGLVIDELELVRNVGLKSDLYLVDPGDGSRTRLTREARAGDPDVSRGGVVACTVQLSDRRALATFTLPPPGGLAAPQILIGEPDTEFSSPRWSPDARWIAAERRRLGGPSQIVIIDSSSREVRSIANLPGGRSAAPAWMPDGSRVLFGSAVDGDPFRIYSVELATGDVARLEGTGPGAQSPEVSPDGRTLAFVGYTVEGFDLFSIALDQATWTPLRAAAVVDARAQPSSGAAPASAARTYSPLATLPPRFWTPTVESDAGELVIGAATGSADVLGRHVYGAEAGWSGRARPDWQVGYAYDRWWPTLFAAIADDTDPWRSGETRTQELDLGLLLPVSRVRFSHASFFSFHRARDTFECFDCSPSVDSDFRRASLRFGWDFTSAKSFGYSISAEEGFRVSVTGESTRTALGADGNGVASTVDARSYWRAGPKHAVLALRGAGAGSWGDPEAARQFSASGHGPQPAGFGFGSDAIGLLRGFDEGDISGTRALVLNTDYRVPLARVDRGAGTIPVFVRSLHASMFVDAGTAWSDRVRWSDLRVSIGAELSVDTVIGFVLPVTATVGGAWRRDGAEGERGLVGFARIGRAF